MPSATHSTNPFFTTPKEVAEAFYGAFESGDLDSMMAVWAAEDEEIICVHPGAIPLLGYSAVRAAWKAVFGNGMKLRIELRDPLWHITATMATQTVVEWIRIDQETAPRGGVAVTNTFVQTMRGWRLLSHHASPISGDQHVVDQNTVLH